MVPRQLEVSRKKGSHISNSFGAAVIVECVKERAWGVGVVIGTQESMWAELSDLVVAFHGRVSE